jgi:nitrogenase molybdenum-iron protein beta chain
MSGVIQQPRYTCALGGMQTVLAIPGALPIVHGGPGCAEKVSGFLSMDNGFQGEGYGGGAHVSCTNTYEQEVVFGGEKKLRQTIDGAMKVLKGELFVVVTGCTADIVGDDSINIAKEYAGAGHPLVGTETAGFKGNNYFGHETVVNAILEQFLEGIEARPRKGLVNIFSVVPFQNPYWRGDLEAIKYLVESIGLKANILFGYGSRGVKEWKEIPHAEFNLLLSPWIGLSAVKYLEDKYGIPFLHYPVLPVGDLETSAFLRSLGAYAGIDESVTEKVIEREETRYYKYMATVVDFIADYRGNIPSELYAIADSAYGISLSSFLINEMGFALKGLYITDDPPKQYCNDIIKTAESRNERFIDTVFFEVDGALVHKDIRKKLGESKKALILGSSWEKMLAQETSNHYSFISLPLPETVIINKTFIGYNGGLNFIEEIFADLFKTKVSVTRNILSSEVENKAYLPA